MKPRGATLLAAFVLLVLMTPPGLLAAEPLNGSCDTTQLNDNSWIVRDAATGPTGPWLTSVSGSISRYDYSLCTTGTLPWMTASGAWVAIEGPNPDAIVQVGYQKCGQAVVCGNSMHTNQLDYFYSSGSISDVNHKPWPKNISLADGAGSHVFTVRLVYKTDGSRVWEYLIDNQVKMSEPDGAWRDWNRDRAQVGTEIWNCGDQMGGRTASGSDPGNKQKFRGLTWVAGGVTHSGEFGASEQRGNNPTYPWLFSQDYNTSDFDVWTSGHAQTCDS